MSWLNTPRQSFSALVLTIALLFSDSLLHASFAQHSPKIPPYKRGKEGEAFRGLSGRVLESLTDNPFALRAAPFAKGESVTGDSPRKDGLNVICRKLRRRRKPKTTTALQRLIRPS